MNDKSYNDVLQILEEIRQSGTENSGELDLLRRMMLEYKDKYMEAVSRLKAGGPGPETVEEDEEGRQAGTFRRLPKGGVIETTAGSQIFVPEVWVRNLGIEHGDIVSAVPLGMLDKSPLYEFTVEERKGLGDTSDRVSVIGPVNYHSGEWFVYSEEEESLISLRPKEVRELSISEGDLVEVAYPAGDMYSARIAWKYDPSEQYLFKTEPGAKRKKTPARQGLIEIADPVLSGKSVLVVGGDLYKESYKQNFERRGVKFLWESGFQGGQGKSIESKIRSADVVVMITEMMSHRLPNVESMCRKYKKPYVYAPSKGVTGAVRASQSVFIKKR